MDQGWRRLGIRKQGQGFTQRRAGAVDGISGETNESSRNHDGLANQAYGIDAVATYVEIDDLAAMIA